MSKITKAQRRQFDLYRELLVQFKTLKNLIEAGIGVGVVSGNEIVLTNTVTGIKTRIIATETGYRFDVTLTALGFDGVESTDGGVTGDWVTTAGA